MTLDSGFRPYLDGNFDAGSQLRDHIFRRSEALFRKWRGHNDILATVEDVQRRQAYIRRTAFDALGGIPQSNDPLSVEHCGSVSGDGYRIDKIIYETTPQQYVTANLYLPDHLTAPTGAVVFVCGHGAEAKAYPRYQAVCARLARNGLIALGIDPFGQGERFGYLNEDGTERIANGVIEHIYAGVQCWWMGNSPGRYFVQDAQRAIDYLISRPDVDPARIGITGNSGGGTQATLMMMLDPRLAAAAPGTFVMSRREYLYSGQPQDAEQIILGGTLNGIDHEDFLIAMAPRPVRVLATDFDFFPIEGTLDAVARARRAYAIAGAAEHLDLTRVRSTHQYHPELAKSAVEFFVWHLRPGDDNSVDHGDPLVLPASELQCTESGQLLTERPKTQAIFDLNLAEYNATPPQGDAQEWLTERVLAHRTLPAEFFPRWLPATQATISGIPVTIRQVFWKSEVDIFNAGVLVTPDSYSSLTLALFENGSADIDDHQDLLADRLASGHGVFVLDVRGTGSLEPNPINNYGVKATLGTLYRFTCDLLWLGDSLAASQAFDVLRCLEFLRADTEIALNDRPIDLYGHGTGAFLTVIAAALDGSSPHVEIDGPLLDPADVVSHKYYGDGTQWRQLIPGMAAAVDFSALRRAVLG